MSCVDVVASHLARHPAEGTGIDLRRSCRADVAGGEEGKSWTGPASSHLLPDASLIKQTIKPMDCIVEESLEQSLHYGAHIAGCHSALLYAVNAIRG